MKKPNWNLVLGCALLLIVIAACLLSFFYLPYPIYLPYSYIFIASKVNNLTPLRLITLRH